LRWRIESAGDEEGVEEGDEEGVEEGAEEGVEEGDEEAELRVTGCGHYQ
jgi:hypothetical protein